MHYFDNKTLHFYQIATLSFNGNAKQQYHPEVGGWVCLPLEMGRGVPTKRKIWTHTDTKIVKKTNPLGYQTLNMLTWDPLRYQIPFHTYPPLLPPRLTMVTQEDIWYPHTNFHPQNWWIMWFELHCGTDYWCLPGLCQSALSLWCSASGEDRKPNRKNKIFKSLTC